MSHAHTDCALTHTHTHTTNHTACLYLIIPLSVCAASDSLKQISQDHKWPSLSAEYGQLSSPGLQGVARCFPGPIGKLSPCLQTAGSCPVITSTWPLTGAESSGPTPLSSHLLLLSLQCGLASCVILTIDAVMTRVRSGLLCCVGLVFTCLHSGALVNRGHCRLLI